jgi:hypothetical protein
MILTAEEGRKLHVLTLLEARRISVGQAAEALGLTPRQVRRLRVGLRREGPTALIHGNRGRRSARRLPDALRKQIVALARGRYAGLNDHHLTEKLTAVEGLSVSRATVQRVLRAAGVASPRRRRPPRHRQRRLRRAQAGLLLQLDGSPYAWFGPSQPACSLLAAIDYATGAVLAGTFRYLRLLTLSGALSGSRRPSTRMATGSSSATTPTGHSPSSSRGSRSPRRSAGPSRRWASTTSSPSPQAKGRIERLWNTFQDRLVVELALAGIRTPAAGDAFLATTFLPAFNARFAVPAPIATSAYRPVPRGCDLDRVCAFHYPRQVALDNTVRVEEVVLQLAPGPQRRSYARVQADVVQCLDGSWRVYVGDRLVTTTPAPPDPGQLRARKRR